MADGFLGRWSQRKLAVRAGQPWVESAPPLVQLGTASGAVAGAASTAARASTAPTSAGTASAPALAQPTQEDAQAPFVPAPTLHDVQALQPDDSFARFVAPDVAPDVRNAAMKKLFADPHYNVMDGLDIYIDDYSLPSPLPAALLRQMASAKFLNLFEEDPPMPVGEDAHGAPAPGVAQSAPNPNLSDTQAVSPVEPVPASAQRDLIKNTSHDHLDLRLQPDHATGCASLEHEPERNPDPTFEPVPPRSG